MLNNGDKLIVVKKVAPFLNEGDVVKVTNVTDDGIISFAFGEGLMHMGVMNTAECESHFEKVEEKNVAVAPTINEEYIAEIMENSEFEVHTAFDKCTVVSCRLPNGFVITEYSACVSPENYDEDMGVEICVNKIKNKVWELEGYRLQQWLWENDCCCEECEDCDCDCECDCECECECEEEIEVEIETDIEIEVEEDDCDCNNCDSYDCPFNHNIFH